MRWLMVALPDEQVLALLARSKRTGVSITGLLHQAVAHFLADCTALADLRMSVGVGDHVPVGGSVVRRHWAGLLYLPARWDSQR